MLQLPPSAKILTAKSKMKNNQSGEAKYIQVKDYKKNTDAGKCYNCGSIRHNAEGYSNETREKKCQEFNVICKTCRKKVHFTYCCRTKGKPANAIVNKVDKNNKTLPELSINMVSLPSYSTVTRRTGQTMMAMLEWIQV